MIDYTADRPIAVFDTECWPNYWSLGFKTPDGRKKLFELWNDEVIGMSRQDVARIIRQYRIVGFFSKKYDIPMILKMMSGATNAQLKRANDELIPGGGLKGPPWWVFYQNHGLFEPDYLDHIDLENVSPGSPTHPSLKLYAGRLHSRKMQELPLDINEHIDAPKLQVIRSYHDNDLDVTLDLWNELKIQVGLRAILSKECGVDVRSKSDAQVAEAAIKAELERIKGEKIYAPEFVARTFKYKVPPWVKFETVAMRAALGVIASATFRLDQYTGTVQTQDDVRELAVKIGESTYKMGIGGLHSQESKVSHYSDDDSILLDRDVTGYYPQTILLQGMYPKHLGPVVLEIYRRFYIRRTKAKFAGDKDTAETLKIVNNGFFGKLGDSFSIFFEPELMIQVTLTGQLAILMLIEQLELHGISVISGNTDGIVSKVPRHLRGLFNAIFIDWEIETGYTTEEAEYLSVHSQSVNSYIALKKDKKTGKIEAKRKGKDFTKPGPGQPGASGLKKNPNMEICTDALIEYLAHGTPIEETIEWCLDIRKFLVVQRVKGGAEKDDQHVGKAIRWYYSTETRTPFLRADNGNTVPKSAGGKPLLELKTWVVPADLDHDYYIREAYALLRDFGIKTHDPRLIGRSGRLLVRHPDKKNIHFLDLPSETALCGAGRESIRDSWIELSSVPDGHRMCAQCRKAAGEK